MGGGTDEILKMRIVKGFAVEQVGNTVEVKLDINGDASDLSVAVGAHAHGTAAGAGATAEYGQQIGGRDFNFNFEGNGSETLDFSSKADGTYVVRLRFLFGTSDTDNRAFWNPSTKVESIQSMETRHAPLWEIREDLQAASPPAPVEQWIDLAEVDVASNSITAVRDLRDFAFEGAAPFESSSQGDTFGPYPGLSGSSEIGFSRDSDRADPTVGISAVYPALRALARQIMDLKGQDSSGKFNWFGQVFRGTSASDSTYKAETTKSLRTVDQVTFTIGDGSTEWGDFNGTSGLNDCLKFIDNNSNSFPNTIKIVLKSRRSDSVDQPKWPITDQINLVNKYVTIEGATGGVRGSGRHLIEFQSGSYLRWGQNSFGVGSLHLENVQVRFTADEDRMLEVLLGGAFGPYLGQFTARNSLFENSSGGQTSRQMIVPGRRLSIEGCEFTLVTLYFYGSTDLTSSEEFGSAGGLVSNSVFRNTIMVLRPTDTTTTIANVPVAIYSFADGLKFDNCTFSLLGSAYSQSDGNGGAFIDMMGCYGVAFTDCDMVYDADVFQCIRLGAAEMGDSALRPNVNCSFDRVNFLARSSFSFDITRGYAIRVRNWNDHVPDSFRDETNEWNRGLSVTNCVFKGSATSGTNMGFGFRADYMDQSMIKDCEFRHNPTGKIGTMYSLLLNVCTTTEISGCYFGNTTRNVSENLTMLYLGGCIGITVHHCIFNGVTSDFVADQNKVFDATGARAINIVLCSSLNISDNEFNMCLVNGSATSEVCIVANGIQTSRIERNAFRQCFGRVIVMKGAAVRNNYVCWNKFIYFPFTVGNVPIDQLIPRGTPSSDGAVITIEDASRANAGIDNGSFPNIVTKNHFHGNTWDLTEAGSISTQSDAFRAIHGGGDRYASFSGNHFFNGLLILEDYPSPVLPDTDRSFGWGSAQNLVGGAGFTGYVVE